MNYSEVKALLEAGFNADEIREMLNPQNPHENTQPEKESKQEPEKELKQEPEKESKQEPEKESKQEPEKESKQEPEKESKQESDNRFNQLNETMTKILKAIQGNNLQNNSIQTMDADIDTKVDKIMGSLIRPEHEKKEG